MANYICTNFWITDYCFLLLKQTVQKLHALMKLQEMTSLYNIPETETGVKITYVSIKYLSFYLS